MNNDQALWLLEFKALCAHRRQKVLNYPGEQDTTLKRTIKHLSACYTHLHNRHRAKFEASYTKLTATVMDAIEKSELRTQAGECSECDYNSACVALKDLRDEVDIMSTGLGNAGLWKIMTAWIIIAYIEYSLHLLVYTDGAYFLLKF